MKPKLQETLSKYQTIILVGGGTGGHIQPIVSIAIELKDKDILWIGGKDSNEQIEAKKIHIPFAHIPTLKLSTTRSPEILLYPFVLLRGILEARKILCSVISTKEISCPSKLSKISRPHSLCSFRSKGQQQICIFSKGGPGSVAIGIAAWTLGIPLYIHESDTIPGKSNRILGKLATRIFLGFESAKKYFESEKCDVIGQILGASFVKQTSEGSNISLKKQKEISPTSLLKEIPLWNTNKPHILVICGSQGSQVIFTEIFTCFKKNEDYEWIISLGKLNAGMKKDFENMKDTQAFEWISQEGIALLLEDTDIAITRGSATTLAEIDIFGVRKIIVPLPYSAENHQYWNAREYVKKGDILLEQKNLDQLTEIIQKIGQNSQHSKK